MIRRRVRVGAKAKARIRKGGPTSVHRKALPRADWQQLVEHCLGREDFSCWWCSRHAFVTDWRAFCRSPIHCSLDPHHVVKRSLGGADTADNVVMLCRPCHNATDAPYSRGKLVIWALGQERFCGAVVTARGKSEGQVKAIALLLMAESAVLAG